jgi:formamidopyrimidine-DNA glycosylase
MPELPEVETMRRGIAAVVGSRIRNIERPPCRRRPILIAPRIDAFRRRAVGASIAAVDRAGKRVVLRLDSGDAIVLEPRMTGLVLLAEPPTWEHLRLRIELDAQVPCLWFWDRRGLGTVRLVDPHEFRRRYGSEVLGPDALTISPEQIRARLSTSRRAIKVALLDQRALAGVGNLYASEILHQAAIHPLKRCNQIRPDEWRRIHQAIWSVLDAAVRHEGSTLSDGTYRNALAQNGGYQNQHRVYDRAGKKCTSCGSAIVERIVQAQRSTFFCRRCQPLRRAGNSSPKPVAN